MAEMIERFGGVNKVECELSQGPGREWDCTIEDTVGRNVGNREVYFADDFKFSDFDEVLSKSWESYGEGVKVVANNTGGRLLDCGLHDRGHSILLACNDVNP